MRFADKRIWVLGGGSGIGLAVAQAAAREGGAVTIVARRPERLDAALAVLPDGADGHVADLADEAQTAALFARAEPFDHLVFTAGDALQVGAVGETDLAAARAAYDVRVWGALAAAKHAAPHIRPGGSVTLTTGVAGRRPLKGWAVAAGVCGAIESLARGLALELAPLRVNAVAPGLVRTPLWDPMPAQEREAVFAHVGAGLPVGRVGEADDLAKAYLYLMEGGYSTGQTVVVDGGGVLV